MKEIEANGFKFFVLDGKEKVRIQKKGLYITESSGFIKRFLPNGIQLSSLTEEQARKILRKTGGYLSKKAPCLEVLKVLINKALEANNFPGLRVGERPEEPKRTMFGFDRLTVLADQKAYDNLIPPENVILPI